MGRRPAVMGIDTTVLCDLYPSHTKTAMGTAIDLCNNTSPCVVPSLV